MSSSEVSAPDPPTAGDPVRADWQDRLRAEVEHHPAVRHPLVERISAGALPREALVTFGLQHHALVGRFTRAMEELLVRAPTSTEKLWLAKVLVDEYGEGSDGHDHTTLYRGFLRALGVAEGRWDEVVLGRAIVDFVVGHQRLVRHEPFLVGLGALGPGHEWAIPAMFSGLAGGLVASGLTADDVLYFSLHTEQDVHHGAWMAEALERLVRTPADLALVERGARTSLALRQAVWDEILARVDGGGDGQGCTFPELLAATGPGVVLPPA